MDVVGFVVLGMVTGVGGGSLRDVLLGSPVFWVSEPAYPSPVHWSRSLCSSQRTSRGRDTDISFGSMQSAWRYLPWTGAEKAAHAGAHSTVAVAMGVIAATFGGIVRDLLGGETPVILSRAIYASAALAGAVVFIVSTAVGALRELAIGGGFAIALLIRAAALRYGWSLPRYRRRSQRDPPPP